jgi:hypothetical protein
VASVGAVIALHACGSGAAQTTITQAVSTTAATAATPTETSPPSPTSLPSPTSPLSTAPRPTCSTYYRASVTVPPDEGPVLIFTEPGASEAAFSDLILTATYSDDGFESPSLNVRVETMPDRALVFASLYQFVDPTADLNAFGASGQGFTGLIYVYNPSSGSEVQFVCRAD